MISDSLPQTLNYNQPPRFVVVVIFPGQYFGSEGLVATSIAWGGGGGGCRGDYSSLVVVSLDVSNTHAASLTLLVTLKKL